jgi:hypothetical protein
MTAWEQRIYLQWGPLIVQRTWHEESGDWQFSVELRVGSHLFHWSWSYWGKVQPHD